MYIGACCVVNIHTYGGTVSGTVDSNTDYSLASHMCVCTHVKLG